jgi:hypothetical protein
MGFIGRGGENFSRAERSPYLWERHLAAIIEAGSLSHKGGLSYGRLGMKGLAPELNQKPLDPSGAGPLLNFGCGFPAALDNRLEIALTSFVKSPLAPPCQRGVIPPL